MDWGADGAFQFPDRYAVELRLNGAEAQVLTLLPVEGGQWIEP